ncbi:hypothetical protein ZWY2020_036685 [Hordeum vulgare]|nr:hypothetical protein ZWY2020_036685 [Hordeum vulgare]
MNMMAHEVEIEFQFRRKISQEGSEPWAIPAFLIQDLLHCWDRPTIPPSYGRFIILTNLGEGVLCRFALPLFTAPGLPGSWGWPHVSRKLVLFVRMCPSLLGRAETPSTWSRDTSWLQCLNCQYTIIQMGCIMDTEELSIHSVLELQVSSSSFDVMHPNSEFECLIPLSKLLKSSDFMDADCCVFGVKILQIDVFSPERKAITKDTTVQNLFIQKNRFIKQTYTTIIKDFPQLNSKDRICSPTFELGGHKWYLGIYPRGEQCSTGWLSVYLYRDAVDDDHPCKSGPAVELALSVVDQKFGVDHIRRSLGLVVFPSDHLHRWGFSKFCLLSIIMDRSRGYLMESSCAIEVGITVVGLSN